MKKNCSGITVCFIHWHFMKIARIYVHAARGDKENIFPAAISKDGRSYNEQVDQLFYCDSMTSRVFES